jgi:RNA polymerase sigma factor (sigma-70 family)
MIKIDDFYYLAERMAGAFLKARPVIRHLKDDILGAAYLGLVRAWNKYNHLDDIDFKKAANPAIWRAMEEATRNENTIIIKRRTLEQIDKLPKMFNIMDHEGSKEDVSLFDLFDSCDGREKKILYMMYEGFKQKDIAKHMKMSPRNIRHIIAKLRRRFLNGL